jgi:hypothetical protein
MRAAALIAVVLSLAGIGVAAAQETTPRPTPGPAPDTSCLPDTRETPPTVPPTVGRGNRDLSDRLAESRGVICPPRGVDREIELRPPPGGDIKVIPAPGAPGGNPDVQPK